MGYLEIVVAGVLWGTSGPLVRNLAKAGFTPWEIVLGRAVVSAIIFGMWMVIYAKKRRTTQQARNLLPNREDLWALSAGGFFGVVLSQPAYFHSITKSNVAVAATLNYTAPLFVMIISFLIYDEPITVQKAILLFGGVAGVGLVSGILDQSSNTSLVSLEGAIFGLFSGFNYGCQTIVINRIGRKYSPVATMFWITATGAVILMAGLTVTTGIFPRLFSNFFAAGIEVCGNLMLLSLGSGVLAFVLFAHGLSKVDAARGSAMAMSEPVAACIVGRIVFSESLTVFQIAGLVLVLGCMLMIRGNSVYKVRKNGSVQSKKNRGEVEDERESKQHYRDPP